MFSKILERMQGSEYLKLENDPFMPLVVERIGEDITTVYGNGDLYSLCHYYEQNGDLMQDPEMCFIVVDNRERLMHAPELLHVIPYSFQQANLALYEESITFEQGKPANVDAKTQLNHVVFANSWLDNINLQGFLKSK